MLGAADGGQTNGQIAVGGDRVTPSKARKGASRFRAEGLDGLRIGPGRVGRGVYPAAVVADAKAVACELPTTKGVPTSRWSLAELREE